MRRIVATGSRRSAVRAARLAAVGLTALALSGCGSAADLLHTGATPTPGVTATGTSVYDLAVGDCFDAELGSVLASVDLEDCAGAHRYEVYASLLEPDGDFSATAIRQDAEARCAAAFADFVGVRYEDSRLVIDYLAPTGTDWTAGNRDVLCLLSDPGALLTGSAAGTAQ